MLRGGMEAPFTAESFLQRCEDLLGNEIATRLRKVTLEPDGHIPPNDTAADWYGFETYLRNCVSELRRLKMKLAPGGDLRPDSMLLPSMRKRIEDAMAMSAPAAREEALDRIRLDYLDGLAAGHSFDMTALTVYLIKLLILDRRSSRNLERGRRAFDTLLDRGFAQAGEKRIGEEL